MLEIGLLLLAVALIAVCGIFVAAEFSLIAVNRSTVERHAAHGDKKAQGIAQALKTLSSQLSGAQVGITVTNLAIGFLAEPAISSLIQDPLSSLGVSESAVRGISIVIGITLATAATMVFGELIPKNLAISRPMMTARFVQAPHRLFTRLNKYPIKLLNGSANVILKQFGVQPIEQLASARSADELLSLVRRSAEHGTLPKETALMLERSLNFGDLTALDVMTPRVRVKEIGVNEPVSKVVKLAQQTGLSRFPVICKNLDDIVGVVHIKHAISVPRQDRHSIKVEQIMRPPILIPSAIQLEPLLDSLRKGGLQMAIVIDEFGGTDGIVTIEDLLEELVGEVQDEHDRIKASIRKRANGSWLLSGLLRPDEIGEELGIFLPDNEEFETIAGLVTHELERIPEVDDAVTVEAVDRDGNKIFTKLIVERMDGHRVDRIQLIIIDQDVEGIQS